MRIRPRYIGLLRLQERLRIFCCGFMPEAVVVVKEKIAYAGASFSLFKIEPDLEMRGADIVF